MTNITVRGYQIKKLNSVGANPRKALQIKNDIIGNLKKIGIDRDSINIDLEPVVIKKAAAFVSFYFQDKHLYFSHKKLNFIENLHVVSKVIENEVNSLISEQKTVEQFIDDFSEELDVEKERKKARELLGLEENNHDMEIINKNYKELAKEHHPDKEGGNTEKFQELNKAHKILKRELQ